MRGGRQRVTDAPEFCGGGPGGRGSKAAPGPFFRAAVLGASSSGRDNAASGRPYLSSASVSPEALAAARTTAPTLHVRIPPPSAATAEATVSELVTRIRQDILQDNYYQQNFPNDGQRFLGWYLRNIYLR